MAQIGYEKEVSLGALLDAAERVLDAGAPAALGGLLVAAMRQARLDCESGLGPTRTAIEEKTQAQGHPWFGKRVVWKPHKVKGLKRDGKLILQVLQEYEVL